MQTLSSSHEGMEVTWGRVGGTGQEKPMSTHFEAYMGITVEGDATDGNVNKCGRHSETIRGDVVWLWLGDWPRRPAACRRWLC